VKKLLIADDEEGIRALVRMTLDTESLEILEAADGDEAVTLARENRPDVILLDVMMPGRSGFDVCRTLKSDPATAAIPVVILTAKAQTADREEGRAAGADDYLTKPFSPVELLHKVDDLLDETEP
jgi:two-component system phosphate regulon response regulator PhoB